MKEIEKDKHGFTVTKHKFSFRLVFKFFLTAAVCIYALYRCSLRACADIETVTLTPEQTYALYMRDASVTYHDTSGDTDYSLGTILMGTSSEIAPPENLFVSGSLIDSTSTTILPLWKMHNYIIVRFTWPRDVPTIPTYARDDFITIENNLNISGLNYYSGRILVTIGNAYRPTNNTAWSSVIRTDYSLQTSNGVVTRQNAIGGSGRPSRILTGLSQNLGVIPQDDILYLTSDSAAYWFDDVNSRSITKLTTIWRSPVQWGYTDQYHTNINRTNSWIAYIECPTLSSGYIPPATTPQTTVVTTKPDIPAETAASKPAAGTVDLSNLESGVAALVSQNVDIYNDLEWIGGNVMISANNLYSISMQLERIYQKMWDNGEIPLNAGLQPPNNESLMEFMHSALATQSNFVPQTTYNLRVGLSTYFDIGNSLLSSPIFAPFLLVSAVGLALAVLAFVLFRGY